LQTSSGIPFGFIVSPLAEMSQAEFEHCDDGTMGQVPVVDVALKVAKDENGVEKQISGPFRCKKCMAYFNANSTFLGGGHKA